MARGVTDFESWSKAMLSEQHGESIRRFLPVVFDNSKRIYRQGLLVCSADTAKALEHRYARSTSGFLKQIGAFVATAAPRAPAATLLAYLIGLFATDRSGESFGVSLTRMLLVGYLVLLCGYLIRRTWEEIEDRMAVRSKHPNKSWIVGLSIAVIFLIWQVASDHASYLKAFAYATESTTGTVLDSDPGFPGSPGPDGDSGVPPSSHYQFKHKGLMYEGWMPDELPVGEEISVRFNPSNPEFSHADADRTSFLGKEYFIIILAIILAVLIVSLIRDGGASRRNEPSRAWMR